MKAVANVLRHNTTLTELLLRRPESVEGKRVLVDALSHNTTLFRLHLHPAHYRSDLDSVVEKVLGRNRQLKFTKIMKKLNENDPALTEVSLWEPMIDDQIWTTALKSNTVLTELRLYKVPSGFWESKTLATIMNHSTLTTLDCVGEFKPIDVKHFSDLLKHNISLSTFQLHFSSDYSHTKWDENYGFGLIGAEGFAEALKQNTTLTVLSLVGLITAKGEQALAAALEHNTTLTEFSLRDNRGWEEWHNKEAHEKVQVLLERNKKLAVEKTTKPIADQTSLASADPDIDPSHPLAMTSNPPKVLEMKKEQKRHGSLESADHSKKTKSIAASFVITYSELKFDKELGRGGFGVVHQGTWRSTQVAIKQLLSSTFSKETVEEFNREGTIMAGLRNPNIVQFYGYCPSPHYCLVMEYMPKGSLYGLLHSDHPLDLSMCYHFVVDIANGLAFLHACNPPVLHRDLKSLNILLDQHFRAKLSDFGLSKIKSETRHTSAKGQAVGTPAWMAPETMKREPEYTKKSDIYSFAIVLWEIYSRKLPFADAAQPHLIINWVLQGDREKIPVDCPKKIALLITQCWMGNPKDRPDIQEIVDYLKSDRDEFKSAAAVKHTSSGSAASKNTVIYANLDSGVTSVGESHRASASGAFI